MSPYFLESVFALGDLPVVTGIRGYGMIAGFDLAPEATLGARTTLDVLNAEQELLDARANLISAQVDEIAAGYTLLSAMGELTAQKLRLKVRIYDPAGYYNMVKDAPAGMSAQGKKLDRVLRRVENK